MKKHILKILALALVVISVSSLVSCGGFVTFPIAVNSVLSNFDIEDGVYYTSDFTENPIVVVKGSKMYAIPHASYHSFACHIEFSFVRTFDDFWIFFNDAEIYDTALPTEDGEGTTNIDEENPYIQYFINDFVKRTNGMKFVELETGFMIGNIFFAKVEAK